MDDLAAPLLPIARRKNFATPLTKASAGVKVGIVPYRTTAAQPHPGVGSRRSPRTPPNTSSAPA